MGNTATLETMLGVVSALIPATILLTLVLLWLRRPRHRREAVAPPVKAQNEPLRVIAEPLPLYDIGCQPIDAQPEEAESVDTIAAKIENAIARGDKTSLSQLYFELAAACEREGKLDARMTALRSAAGHGALHGPHAAHAAARLALAEVAHQSGDLTSACEQWQLARTAFQEGGDAEQHARVEKRMRENGCPTDWVLTDF